jgi:hypothetical protein
MSKNAPRPTTKRRRNLGAFDIDKCFGILERAAAAREVLRVDCGTVTRARYALAELQAFRVAYAEEKRDRFEMLYQTRLSVDGAFLIMRPTGSGVIDDIASAMGYRERPPPTFEDLDRMLDGGASPAAVPEQFSIENILRTGGPEIEPDVVAEPSEPSAPAAKPSDPLLDKKDLP